MTSGIDCLEFALKIQCVLLAFAMRFQREFDKNKNVGGRLVLLFNGMLMLFLRNNLMVNIKT